MKLMSSQCQLLNGVSLPSDEKFSGIRVYDASDVTSCASDPGPRILISDQLEPAQVVRCLIDTGGSHIVQKNAKHFYDDIQMTGQFLIDPRDYFENPGACLLPNVIRKVAILYSSPQDKPRLKQQVADFIAPLHSQSISESVDAIIEELYMNAIFDAPREALKRGAKNSSYQRGIYSAIRLHQSADRLVISCEDPFGSLDLKKFLSRMSEVYQKGAGNAINLRGEGGAGLGCVVIFEHSETLMLGVMPGRKTIVCCVLPLGLGNRQRDQLKKGLHLVLV